MLITRPVKSGGINTCFKNPAITTSLTPACRQGPNIARSKLDRLPIATSAPRECRYPRRERPARHAPYRAAEDQFDIDRDVAGSLVFKQIFKRTATSERNTATERVGQPSWIKMRVRNKSDSRFGSVADRSFFFDFELQLPNCLQPYFC